MFRLLKKFGTDYRITILIVAATVTFVVLQRQGFLLPGPATETTPPAARTLVAPDFALPDLEGNVKRLSDFQGKVVLLNFWATWCPPCRAEMPSMETLYQAYQDQGQEDMCATDPDGTWPQRCQLLVPGNVVAAGLYTNSFHALATTGAVNHAQA